MALNEHDFQEMAEAFLNCGNNVLKEAATEWAKKQGYTIMQGMGERGTARGSGAW